MNLVAESSRNLASQFWRLCAWNQDVGNVGVPLKALENDASCLFQLPVAPGIPGFIAA